jgi:Tetratricopeptide repeat
LSRGRSEKEILQEIAAWKQREPSSPEPYVVAANYYLKRTIQPTQLRIDSTEGQKSPRKKGKAGSAEFSIVDPKTGKEVGVMGEVPTGPKPNAQTVQKLRTDAARELEGALKVAPNRFDIMMGRALVLRDARDWKSYASQMEIALQRVSRDAQNLVWLENKPPPRSPKEEVVHSLQAGIMEAFKEESPAGDKRGEQLAVMGTKYLPDSVELLTDCGTARAHAKDWAGAAKIYEHAARIAPTDSIVLINLARAYLNLGEHAKAEAAAKKVIELNNHQPAVENATDILETLSKKPRS